MMNAWQSLNRYYRSRIEVWEHRLATHDTNRVVRPFEWGTEWSRSWPCAARVSNDGREAATYFRLLNQAAIGHSDEFFAYRTPADFRLEGDCLRFTSAVATPYPENNRAQARWFPAPRNTKSAVIVLPHWNASAGQHVALCRLLNLAGLAALRLSLPYHDARMPPELERADYAVSANIGRTIDAARQAVIDTRSCVDWLEMQGYRKFGIVGTSLGSCYAFLTSAHEPRLQVNVFNLFSLHFADVIWTGLSTRHVRQGMDGRVELEPLRDSWAVIAPASFMDQFARFPKKSLFISAAYDTTFWPEFSRSMLQEMRRRNLDHEAVELPCGHYTLGQTPFNILDGYYIGSFLKKSL